MLAQNTQIRSALNWLGRQISNHENPLAYFDPILGAINPMLERGHTPVRVEDIRDEANDTKTFVLKPAGHWPGFHAGQHLSLRVNINGVRYTRTFSLSSSPKTWQDHGLITITVKRLPGGLVTNWMHDELQPGAVLSLGEPFGDFLLPPNPRPLVYIAGGSGITPILSQLETLSQQDYLPKVTLMYYVRSQADVIGAELLHKLRNEMRNFDLQIFTADRDGLMQADHLKALGNLERHECYLCGPPGLMDLANELLDEVGVKEDQIHATFFSAPKAALDTDELGGEVQFVKAGVSGSNDGEASLLDTAEASGLSPKFGCRMGICHQCSCTKKEGTVVNRLTGKASGPGQETIQLCVSVPQGPVDIDI